MAEIRRIPSTSNPPKPVGRTERKNPGDRNPSSFREALERQRDDEESRRQEDSEEKQPSPASVTDDKGEGEAVDEESVGRILDRRA